MGERGETKVEIIDELMRHLKIIDEISHVILMCLLKTVESMFIFENNFEFTNAASGGHRFMCLIQE